MTRKVSEVLHRSLARRSQRSQRLTVRLSRIVAFFVCSLLFEGRSFEALVLDPEGVDPMRWGYLGQLLVVESTVDCRFV